MSNPSPLEGEGGARAAKPRGRVRGPSGYSYQTLVRAEALRREMTPAEIALWRLLRGRQVGDAKFRKQQPIGPYVGDFVCQQHRLVIEADGGQHAESKHDERRDAFLASKGYRILRFWNNDILSNLEGVATAILNALVSPHPPTASRRAPPSPSRGEGKDDGASLG